MALTYNQAVEQTITAGEQIHQIVNGTATTEVTVEDGSRVPSIRKALLDNFYFKDPIAWQVGQTENVFNQLRQFTDGSWWYAPSATASNPTSMGVTPVGDPLWKIYDFDAIGKLEPRIDEALRRSYAEAGYNVVGMFQVGFTYVNTNDVGIDLATGKGYTGPSGVVAPGTDPESGGFVDVSYRVLRGSASVADFRLAPDVDWGNAIIRALESNAAEIEFTPLPSGLKYEHANSITFNKDIKGSGVVRYTGAGDAYFASKKISIAQTQFESSGNDLSLWNITNSVGVTFCDNASVDGGLYNVVVNGPSSQFTFCGGATAKYARADNIKIIQCKRSVIEYDAYIYGAAGWGVNIDSSTAALPDQMHGMVVLGQIWGNKAGGVRCVGRNTSGDKSDWIQHPVIGGHIDHNYDDDAPSTPSDGVYMRYTVRPVLCADMLRSSARYGMNIDYVDFPVISNKAYWKNTSGDFLIGDNVVRPMIMPYSGDNNGVNNVPNDTIEYGRSLRTFGNATIGGGQVNFNTLGWIKQFLSGGGQGNLEIDVNTALATRQVKVKNGTRADVRFLVDGGIGARAFSGAPAGTVTKRFSAYDENGNFIGEIPIFTN